MQAPLHHIPELRQFFTVIKHLMDHNHHTLSSGLSVSLSLSSWIVIHVDWLRRATKKPFKGGNNSFLSTLLFANVTHIFSVFPFIRALCAQQRAEEFSAMPTWETWKWNSRKKRRFRRDKCNNYALTVLEGKHCYDFAGLEPSCGNTQAKQSARELNTPIWWCSIGVLDMNIRRVE